MEKQYIVSNEYLQEFLSKITESYRIDASSGGANGTIPYCTIVYIKKEGN